MNYKGMEAETIIRTLDYFIGRLNPIGDSNYDDDMYHNLCTLESVLDDLLDRMQFLLPYTKSNEYSVKRSGDEALRYLKYLREAIDGWLGEYIEEDMTSC